jgi:hypothetical protein
VNEADAPPDPDIALRRILDLVAIRERMRIAEILALPEAAANLQLAAVLALSGTATLEAARMALAMADPRTTANDGRTSGAMPN